MVASMPTGPIRASSIDSAVTEVMASKPKSQTQEDGQQSPADVAHLIKTAGSAEAVIQYLLKEKQSQTQQNAQLWRLVDKQRAMILGLNKDLEKALKDKEKYRKKLKEVVAAYEVPGRADDARATSHALPRVDVDGPKDQAAEAPVSPSNHDTESLNSPVDMSLAPYPITPPADQASHGPQTAVEEILDPAHSMPKASEHALDRFDHEEEERQAAAKKPESPSALNFNIGLPPSRSLPSIPPSVPPPRPPPTLPPSLSIIEATPQIDQGVAQFPPPSAPPPRKPPPAPLQLKQERPNDAAVLAEEEVDSDSDYDSLLEVDEIPVIEKRGRRKTREEDDRAREILAQKDAEMRSMSMKSSASQNMTKETGIEEDLPLSPPAALPKPALPRQNAPTSLAGVLNGDHKADSIGAPLMSPGLPSSPRPMLGQQFVGSPPLSPRGLGLPPAPLSPRPPRAPIPLPPNTPLSTPSPAEPLDLKSPQPLNIVKRIVEAENPPSPSIPSPTDRKRVYRGFITEEYPDLLLPPNALPSVYIQVASSRMKPSRASLMSLTQLEEDPVFTLAIFGRADGIELWRVEKDTTSLAKLDQRLKQCPDFTAKTPDRSLFTGHAPAKLDARRVALNHYMDEMLNTPLDTVTAVEVCKWLSNNTLPPNSDDAVAVPDAGSETSSVKTGPGGRPYKHGYLTKRGKNFGGWKARFFVLEGPQLKYYETPGGAHLGTIKLQSAQIGKQSQTTESSPANNDDLDNQYRHAFLILEPKKKDSSSHVKHVLCAESDKERDQWVDTLLRWIDYKDTDDEGSAGPANEKTRQRSHGSATTNPKKKAYAQEHVQTQGQDALIGISYEGTKQGDMPTGAPPRGNRPVATPDLLFDRGRTDSASYSISTPRDPQVISDAASWGSKMALAPPGPSNEEKKQRKRSFFGFGPKTRSSEDSDSLFGSTPPQATTEYRGPVRQAFGAPLAEAVRYSPPTDVNVPLPAVVFRCIQYLDAKNAILEEGIFRLSGSNVVIKQLKERFNTEGDVNLLTDDTYYDIHAVASLLKLYLRELPTTILTRDLHLEFLSVTELSGLREKVVALSELVQRLPQANGTLLRYLIAFLIKIINHQDMNKMTVRNVGIVFSPTLNIPAPVFAMLLQNYEGIFGITPEEYELPSPVSDSESRPPTEPQPRRPSTAASGGSPHRQRLMDTQRSTPTPPPATMNQPRTGNLLMQPQAAHARMSYEPSYLAQQSAGSQISSRPAYESGFNIPQGYEPNLLQNLAVKQQPSYDQPHYGGQADYQNSPAAYDQPFASRAKRRESSMFMGNMMLQPQSSKSRLREETRM